MNPVERNNVASMLTVPEVAALLRIHAVTVRRHAVELGGVRVGAQWRFPTSIQAPTMPHPKRGHTPTEGGVR